MIKVTRKQLSKIIAENLLLEFSPTFFVANNMFTLTKMLLVDTKDFEEVKLLIDEIRDYYDNDCDEIEADIDEIIADKDTIDSIIDKGLGLVNRVSPDMIQNQGYDKDLIDKSMEYMLRACNPRVANKFKKLIYNIASTIADNPKFNGAGNDDKAIQIVKDFNAGKMSYLA
jgi:hypothetical protein